MTKDMIITLDNNNDYLLLDETTLDEKKYFYAVSVDAVENPTNDYVVIEEINKNGKTLIKKVTDSNMLNLLITLFTTNYVDSVFDEDE